MKRKQVFCAMLCAAFAAVTAGGSALAAGAGVTYRETELYAVDEKLTDAQISDFSVGPEAANYFVFTDVFGMPAEPKRYQSTDGGKTWKPVDMGWFAEIQKQHPGFGNAWDFYITGGGAIYCVVDIGDEISGGTADPQRNEIFAVYVYEDGKARRVPNISLSNTEGPSYKILDVADNGDILIQERRGPVNPIVFMLYSAEGTLKQKTELTSHKGWHPAKYRNNAMYGLKFSKTQPDTMDAVDVQTGQIIRSVPLPLPKSSDRQEALGVAENGTLYYVAEEGLYCCNPGEKAFTLVLKGGESRLGKDAAFGKESVCLDDGTIYVHIFYFDKANPGKWVNMRQGKLYRYSPAQS